MGDSSWYPNTLEFMTGGSVSGQVQLRKVLKTDLEYFRHCFKKGEEGSGKRLVKQCRNMYFTLAIDDEDEDNDSDGDDDDNQISNPLAFARAPRESICGFSGDSFRINHSVYT